METIPTVARALPTVLTATAERAARTSGGVPRVREVTGATRVQTLVFGWRAHPDATVAPVCQTAAVVGVTLTPQGLAHRVTRAAPACLKQVWEAEVGQAVATDPVALPLVERFAAVFVQDSTTITLPAALADSWRGCGHATGQGAAALKAHVRLDLRRGALAALTLTAGRTNDRREQPSPTHCRPARCCWRTWAIAPSPPWPRLTRPGWRGCSVPRSTPSWSRPAATGRAGPRC